MKSEQTVRKLQALTADLQQISATPWSNIDGWVATARPLMSQLIPAYLPNFDEMVKEPQIDVTILWPGGSVQQLEHELKTQNRALPQYEEECKARKEIILLFLQSLMTIVRTDYERIAP